MVEEKIKEGYKETEIGIIPEDWEVVKLSEVINKKPEYGINSAAVPYKESLPTYLRIFYHKTQVAIHSMVLWEVLRVALAHRMILFPLVMIFILR